MDDDNKREYAETSNYLDNQEKRIRAMASHSVFYHFLVNSYAALVVFVHLISLETLLSMLLSVGLTLFIYFTNDDFDGGILNWVLLSFAVITPLSAAVRMAFTRRERALTSIAVIRSTLLEIYLAHTLWDWGSDKGGRSKSSIDWLQHTDEVATEIFQLMNYLARWLTLPNASRARHRTTIPGKREADEITSLSRTMYQGEVVQRRFFRLAMSCEALKRAGLPPNEATRIRQWERLVLEQVEILRTIKLYRTPQALRSFGRLFSVLVPPVYAPFYAQIAVQVNLTLGLVFGILTSIALTALFETVYEIEDPFIQQSVLDGIQVQNELVAQFQPLVLGMRRDHFGKEIPPLIFPVVVPPLPEADEGSVQNS